MLWRRVVCDDDAEISIQRSSAADPKSETLHLPRVQRRFCFFVKPHIFLADELFRRSRGGPCESDANESCEEDESKENLEMSLAPPKKRIVRRVCPHEPFENQETREVKRTRRGDGRHAAE